MLVCLPEENTAFQPEYAQTAAKWVEPARIIADHTIDISDSGQRDLSGQESDEIRGVCKDWRKPGVGALLFTMYFGAIVIGQWFVNPPKQLEWDAYFFIALTLWIDIRFIKVAWKSWQLAKDAKGGIVVITRLPDEMDGEEILHKGAVIEWLPYSNSEWTINGEPAQWRLRG